MDIFAFARSKRSSTTLEQDKKTIVSNLKCLTDDNILDTIVNNLKVDKSLVTDPDIPEYLINWVTSIIHNTNMLNAYLTEDDAHNKRLIRDGKLIDPYVEAVTDCVHRQFSRIEHNLAIRIFVALNTQFEMQKDMIAWTILKRHVGLTF
jgi:hypothetical protein